jgi:hydrogenase-4 component E
VLLIPWLLHRVADRLQIRWDVETLINIPTIMLIGIAVVIFAFNLAIPISKLSTRWPAARWASRWPACCCRS